MRDIIKQIPDRLRRSRLNAKCSFQQPAWCAFFTGATLFYAVIPTFLFCLGWLRWYYALALCSLLLTISIKLYRTWKPILQEDDFVFSVPAVAGSFFIALFFVYFSGIGGFAFQVTDYVKHNAFLYDLMEYDWPIGYADLGPESRPYMLATYMGHYLLPAAVGKLLGWNAANYFWSFWTTFGIWLTLQWLCLLVRKSSFVIIFAFFLLGGLDLIGYFILNGWPESMLEVKYLDTWIFFSVLHDQYHWIYASFLGLLYVGPHHVVGTWIIILMILYAGIRKKAGGSIWFLWSLMPVNSIFVFLGTFPYVVIAAFFCRARKYLTLANVTAAVLLLVQYLFFASNDRQVPAGWLWEDFNLFAIWHTLLLFYVIEFGMYAVFCPRIQNPPSGFPQRIWWWTAIGLLVVFPLYHLGAFADFTSKTAVPSLLVFFVYLVASITAARDLREKILAHVLIVLLVIGAAAPLSVFCKGAGMRYLEKEPISLSRVRHFDHYLNPRWEVAQQLMADPNRFFWKYLSAPREYIHSPDWQPMEETPEAVMEDQPRDRSESGERTFE